MDTFNLVLVRQRAHIEIDKIKKDEAKRRETQKGWLGGWFGRGSKEDNANDSDFGNILSIIKQKHYLIFRSLCYCS